MNRHLIKYKFMVVMMFLVLVIQPIPIEAVTLINIILDNEAVDFTADLGFPFIDVNNRTQVPLRVTLESFGAEVNWDKEKQMAYATYKGIVVHVPINEGYILVNGEVVMNDTNAVIVNNRTYCPIRKVLEAFGAEVTWQAATNSVIVHLNAQEQIGDVKEQIGYQLTILANFTDIKMTTTEKQWHGFWYAADNSVATYYSKMSKGKFIVKGANETSGIVNDGIITVNLDIEHPNFTVENPDYDSLESYSMFESIIMETNDYIDYSLYDRNGDLIVDSTELIVTVIAAGHEESPYRDFSEKAVSGVQIQEPYYVDVDGVNMNSYLITGELMAQYEGDESMATIGVVVHEFGHSLLLPDLYDTDYSSEGLGFHALMASGSNVYSYEYDSGEYPSPMIAWSRIYTKMVNPQTVSQSGTYTLYGNDQEYNILKVETSDPKVYYLLENRQMESYGRTFDFYMDHGGIAIWLIDEHKLELTLADNTPVNNDNDRAIVLIEAGGTYDLYQEVLDVGNNMYNHYFQSASYVSPYGITFTILDDSQDIMSVQVDIN